MKKYSCFFVLDIFGEFVISHLFTDNLGSAFAGEVADDLINIAKENKQLDDLRLMFNLMDSGDIGTKILGSVREMNGNKVVTEIVKCLCFSVAHSLKIKTSKPQKA